MNKTKLLSILLLGTCLFVSNTKSQNTIVSKKIDKPPVIDGKLDDSCWSIAEKTPQFRVLASENPKMLGQMLKADKKFLDNASNAYICHDDKNLYIAYVNPAPEDVPITAKKYDQDSKYIWRGDCNELFIDPLRKKKFFQLGINASGSFTDLEVNPAKGIKNWKWQSNATIKATQQKSGYTVEIAIPLSSLGNPEKSTGTVWGINFTRQGKSCSGLSTWANVGKNFHSVDAFGLLIFGDRKDYHLKKLETLKAKLQKYSASADKKRVKFIKRKIADLKKEIDAEGSNVSNFAQLCQDCEEIDDSIRQLAFKGKNYVFWEKDIWGNLSPNEKVPLDVKETTVLKIFSPQNTYNSTGLSVSNISSKPLMGRFVFKPDTSKEAIPLNRKNIEFYKALYVEMDSGMMIPDALVKLPPMNILEVPARTTVLVWLEIDTHGLKPGKYERTIMFLPSYSGFKQKEFKICLEVIPVDLQAPRLKQWTYITNPADSSSPQCVNTLARHGVTTIYAMLSREGMYPKLDKKGNIIEFDTSVYDKKIANMINAGVKKEDLSFCFWLGLGGGGGEVLSHKGKRQVKYGTPAWEKGFTNSLRTIRDYLFKQGFTYDDISFFPIDEPHGDKNDPKSSTYKTFEAAKFVKKADPKLKVMTNMGLGHKIDKDQLKDYIERVDVLQAYRPHINMDPTLVKQLKNSGREIWIYAILLKNSHPTVYRNLSWENLRDGLSSVTAYWAFDSFAGDGLNSHDSHPRRPNLSADYGTCYVNRKTGEYIPTRRLKAWYQGNQDYRTVHILRKLISDLKAKGKDVSSYTEQLDKILETTVNGTSADMQKAREKILKMICELKAKK